MTMKKVMMRMTMTYLELVRFPNPLGLHKRVGEPD